MTLWHTRLNEGIGREGGRGVHSPLFLFSVVWHFKPLAWFLFPVSSLLLVACVYGHVCFVISSRRLGTWFVSFCNLAGLVMFGMYKGGLLRMDFFYHKSWFVAAVGEILVRCKAEGGGLA